MLFYSALSIVRSMKKLIAVIVALMIITVASVGYLATDSSSSGFGPGDLAAPEIMRADAVNVSMPSPLTATSPPTDMAFKWRITEDIYAGAGGALRLSIENMNSAGRLYIYGFGLIWDDGSSTYRNCSVYVPAGGMASLGLLVFAAPDEPGTYGYRVVVKVAASEMVRTLFKGWSEAWHDYGELGSSSDQSAEVAPLVEETQTEVSYNVKAYYARINSLVSYEAAAGVADEIRAERPGEYNILQIVEAYEWVRDAIRYQEDGAVDYWQSAGETLERGCGDCEDHAILMSSIIGALGGNARVNIVKGHAFPTVFVGTTQEQMAQVEAAIASYYGLPDGQLTASYLVDETGYWLVVDTTGFPYAGGIPAQSGYSADGGWSMGSDYLYAIDATGVVAVGLFDL